MITVHLLRHGQTAWNLERRFLGRTDIALDDVGQQQAARLAAVFPEVAAVYSSPLARAWQTAGAVARGRAVVADPDLVEMDMGVLEGLSGPDAFAGHPALLQQFRADPSSVVIPRGETLAAAGDRMLGAWRRIVAAHVAEPGLAIAVTSHQMAISALLCRLTGAPLSSYQGYTQRNTAWTTVHVERDAVTVIARDQAPHLADPA